MKKANVLLVEDEETVNDLITEFLTQHGYTINAFADAPDALDHIREHGLPHLALIDLGLPSMHGFELASRIKTMGDVPIIFVTSQSDTETIVQGLKQYADDFIVKPFQLRELEARVHVVLSRMPSFDYANSPRIRIDKHLEIDFAHNRLYLDEKPVSMTPTESMLLHILVRNATRVVENRMLIGRVWPGEKVNEDTLRVHMHRLRRKLEADSHHPHYIRTERGVGYIFALRPEEETVA